MKIEAPSAGFEITVDAEGWQHNRQDADGSFIDNPIVGPIAGTGFAVQTMLSLQMKE